MMIEKDLKSANGSLDNSSRGHVPQNGIRARGVQRKAAKVQKRSMKASSSRKHQQASFKLKQQRGDKKRRQRYVVVIRYLVTIAMTSRVLSS